MMSYDSSSLEIIRRPISAYLVAYIHIINFLYSHVLLSHRPRFFQDKVTTQLCYG